MLLQRTKQDWDSPAFLCCSKEYFGMDLVIWTETGPGVGYESCLKIIGDLVKVTV